MNGAIYRASDLTGPLLSEEEAKRRHTVGEKYVFCTKVAGRPTAVMVWSDTRHVGVSFRSPGDITQCELAYTYSPTPDGRFSLDGGHRLSLARIKGYPTRDRTVYRHYEETHRWYCKNFDMVHQTRETVEVFPDPALLPAEFPEFGCYDHLLVFRHPAIWHYLEDLEPVPDVP